MGALVMKYLSYISVPGSMMLKVKPLKHPSLLKMLMVIPKIIALVIIILIFLMVFPFYTIIEAIEMPYRWTEKKYNKRWIFR